MCAFFFVLLVFFSFFSPSPCHSYPPPPPGAHTRTSLHLCVGYDRNVLDAPLSAGGPWGRSGFLFSHSWPSISIDIENPPPEALPSPPLLYGGHHPFSSSRGGRRERVSVSPLAEQEFTCTLIGYIPTVGFLLMGLFSSILSNNRYVALGTFFSLFSF